MLLCCVYFRHLHFPLSVRKGGVVKVSGVEVVMNVGGEK